MKNIVFGVIVGLGLALSVAVVAQMPPLGRNTTLSESVRPASPVTVALAANAVACTAPGGASCTVVMQSTDASAWDNVTLYIKNGGANVADDVLLEASPNGTDWEELIPNTFDALATGKIKSANYIGHYAWLRIEGRAAANTSLSVWLSAFRP
jgi:hypothetical protein